MRLTATSQEVNSSLRRLDRISFVDSSGIFEVIRGRVSLRTVLIILNFEFMRYKAYNFFFYIYIFFF